MKTSRRLRWILLLCLQAGLVSSPAQQMTKIWDSGPDNQKMVLAILGDGYAQNDQLKYRRDVTNQILSGLLKHDFYFTNSRAFNIYRIDLVSKDSGVSTPTTSKDTALGMIYSGDWNRCWMEKSAQTDTLMAQVL